MNRRILFAALCILMSMILFAFTLKQASKEYIVSNDCSFVTMNEIRLEEKLNCERSSVVSAVFDLESEKESTGEIEIYIDGIRKANNRLMIKKGVSQYSVDFIISYPSGNERKESYDVVAKLKINEVTADIKHLILK